MEDLTNPEKKEADPLADRKVAVYGWVRGTNLKPGMGIHIPGCGDLQMTSINFLARGTACPAWSTRAHVYVCAGVGG